MIAEGIKDSALLREYATTQIVRFAVGIGGLWHAMRQASRERAQLLALSERDLRDIGITRMDALRAANQPLWRFSEGVQLRPERDRVAYYRHRGETLRVQAMGAAAARFVRFVAAVVRSGRSGAQRVQDEKRP